MRLRKKIQIPAEFSSESDLSQIVSSTLVEGIVFSEKAELKEILRTASNLAPDKPYKILLESLDYIFEFSSRTGIFEYSALDIEYPITISKIGERYLIYLAHPHPDFDRIVSERLSLPNGLISFSVGLEYTLVDGWWFNIDVQKLLEPFYGSLEESYFLAEWVRQPQAEPYETPTHYGGIDFLVEVVFAPDNYTYKPRGTNIVGRAKYDSCNLQLQTPKIGIVAKPCTDYDFPVVEPEEIKVVMEYMEHLV